MNEGHEPISLSFDVSFSREQKRAKAFLLFYWFCSQMAFFIAQKQDPKFLATNLGQFLTLKVFFRT